MNSRVLPSSVSITSFMRLWLNSLGFRCFRLLVSANFLDSRFLEGVDLVGEVSPMFYLSIKDIGKARLALWSLTCAFSRISWLSKDLDLEL